jgi:predicted XRE-type DNA-binding protein
MKLPEVAKRMREIGELIQGDHPKESDELFELAGEIKRRSGTRAPAASTKVTPELYEEIKEYAEANPTMSHQDIAVIFNVNHGRVSEAINGKRA